MRDEFLSKSDGDDSGADRSSSGHSCCGSFVPLVEYDLLTYSL